MKLAIFVRTTQSVRDRPRLKVIAEFFLFRLLRRTCQSCVSTAGGRILSWVDLGDLNINGKFDNILLLLFSLYLQRK